MPRIPLAPIGQRALQPIPLGIGQIERTGNSLRAGILDTTNGITSVLDGINEDFRVRQETDK